MIGKNQLQIGPTEFATGMASSDWANDGALATNCLGLNPFVTPGIIRGLTTDSTTSTNIVTNFIASCSDASSSLGNNRYYVDDTGNYYTYNGSTITKQKTASGGSYVKGVTDMVPFNGKYYTTTTDDITEWNGAATLNEHYWTTTLAQSALASGSGQWHPLLVFESLLWVGNGNVLQSITTGGVVASALILSSGETICALGIDPGTGLMMISVSTASDNNNQLPSQKIVYLFNGSSLKASRKILVDELISAFYNVGGIVYVGAGRTIGQWNGSGVTFLRKLINVSLVNTDLPYKHNFSNLRNILLVADGQTLLAYGETSGNKKGWFNTGFTVGTNHITCVSPVGNSKIGISFASLGTYFLRTFDFTTVTSSSGRINFNISYFPRPVNIRRVRIFTTGLTTTAGIGGVTIVDENNVTRTTVPASFIVTAGQSPKYWFDFDFEVLLQGMQLIIDTGGQGQGIAKVITYYDPAE